MRFNNYRKSGVGLRASKDYGPDRESGSGSSRRANKGATAHLDNVLPREKDVLRLEVAVQDVPAVEVAERHSNLHKPVHDAVLGKERLRFLLLLQPGQDGGGGQGKQRQRRR